MTASLGLVVPTLNAGSGWTAWLDALDRQTRRPDLLLAIDSSSGDQTAQLARERGFQVRVIPRSAFNHGGTRQLGVNLMPEADIVLFLTQDAVLADADAIERLVAVFAAEPKAGAAYGRQLPHAGAGPIGAHARGFNYPAQSQLRSLEDRHRYGIKTAFISNSFAAYRREALIGVGGFPSDTIMNEDTFVAGRLLLSGWNIAYCAEARVHHSHDYDFATEFRRYFDIGVFHAESPWLLRTFGPVQGEGRRFVLSELAYLARRAPWLIPSALLRSALKWAGFRLGVSFLQYLPVAVKRLCSLYRSDWSAA